MAAVCSACVPEPTPSAMSGSGSGELIEEEPRQLVVVVLSGVEQDLARDPAQPR